MPETRSVESVDLGPLAELAVEREEPLDLVLLEVRLPREGVHQLGLLLPNYFADLRHSPGLDWSCLPEFSFSASFLACLLRTTTPFEGSII